MDKKNTISMLALLVWLASFTLVTAIIASVFVIALENAWIFSDANYDLAKVGAWGDTLGGILNPTLSFLALIGLLWTIRLQSQELEYTRKEIENSTKELAGSRLANEALVKATEQQISENSFFQLFNYFTSSVEQMKFTDKFGTVSLKTAFGARGFELIALEFRRSFSSYVSHRPVDFDHSGNPDDWPPDGLNELIATHGSETAVVEFCTSVFYKSVYDQHQAELGRYYRVTYNILRFLDEKSDAMPAHVLETYSKMFRACLSNHELFLIFLNCLTEKGKPMIKYVERFSLFDNLPPEFLRIAYFGAHGNEIGIVKLNSLASIIGDEAFGSQVSEFRNPK